MSDIFNEIDDELRQERMREFWKDNRFFIIGSIIGAILITAGISFMQDWKIKSGIKETAAFYNALNTSEVSSLIDYTKEAKKDHAALSRFAAVSLLYDKDKHEEALQILLEVQNNRDIKKMYRDFAVLLEAQISLNILNKTDADKLSTIEQKLASVTKSRSVWKESAYETMILFASKKGEFNKAISIIDNALSGLSVSSSMKDRMLKLKSLYVAKQQSKIKENSE